MPAKKATSKAAAVKLADSQDDESYHRPEEGEEDEDWWRYSAVGE